MVDEFEFKFTEPAEPLGRYVEQIWFARGTTAHGRERVLPAPSAVLLVILGPPLRMTAPHPGAQPREIAGVWLSGPHERPIINEPTAETHVAGAVFRPGGIAAFQSGSAELLANRIVVLDEASTTLGTSEEWVESFGSDLPADEALQVLNRRLTAAIAPPESSRAWRRAIEALTSGEFESVAGIQESLGVSRRHFTAEVRRRAGLNPKALQRIARMRRMLAELDARQPVQWSDEAIGAGYSDQAHAIRDFRAFTGLTPSEYVRRRQQAWGHELAPGEAANFVPELIR